MSRRQVELWAALWVVCKDGSCVALTYLRDQDVIGPERRQRDQTKLEQMVVYAQTALCRTAVLLEALGETGVDRCGECDNCRGTAIRAEAVAQGAA